MTLSPDSEGGATDPGEPLDTTTSNGGDPTAVLDSPEQPAEEPARAPTSAKRKTAGKKKGGRKRGGAKKRSGSKSSAAEAQMAKFPRHSLERSLRIPQAIYDQNGGNPATAKEAVAFTGGSSVSGPFRMEISSAKKFGWLEVVEGGRLGLTDRARRAIAPQSESDRLGAFREALLAAPDISAVYNYYRGESLPDQPFFVNALTDRFGLPPDKVPEFLEIFNESVRSAELLDESGERTRLLDIGRDDEHRPERSRPTVRTTRGMTGNCFVMQPFSGHLGQYYETIYRPAIEQAGLSAVRADAEIFGTGKIMDQIWRGIRAADVLIAELTSKNPNVFYELGLAHALEKPVVLVSSNQDDVPFDLRHIRVILYDQTDPFWGQKLIDKVADKIRSAVNDPEDSIFRLGEVPAS